MAHLTAITPRAARISAVVALAASLVLQAAPAAAAARHINEYHVKAAYLFHFTKFVVWNDTPTRPLIVGKDPFGEVLDAAVRGKTVGGRSIEVRRLADAQDVAGCHILIVSRSEHDRVAELARQARAGVLTVEEVPQFCRDGGMVRFFIDGNRIRFHISSHATESSGLRIHSQLMSLAAK